jgi:hypothetical protein
MGVWRKQLQDRLQVCNISAKQPDILSNFIRYGKNLWMAAEFNLQGNHGPGPQFRMDQDLPDSPAVFRIQIRIRIHRIHMFLGPPDPDPSIIKQNSKTNLDSYCFATSFGLFTFEK